jgi:hypothetical protein
MQFVGRRGHVSLPLTAPDQSGLSQSKDGMTDVNLRHPLKFFAIVTLNRAGFAGGSSS